MTRALARISESVPPMPPPIRFPLATAAHNARARGRSGSAQASRVVFAFGMAVFALGSAAVAGWHEPLQAQITRIEISSTTIIPNEADLENAVGDYRVISGRAYGVLAPDHPRNTIITDIELAPKNADGLVEYDTKFTIAMPDDATKMSGVLQYEVVNRGNGAPAANAYGHVQLLSGWQGDVTPTETNYTAHVPTAVNVDGSPITGTMLARLADPPPDTRSMPLAVLRRAIPYDAASLDTRQGRLVKKGTETRTGRVGQVEEVAASEWAFADCTNAPFPGVPDPRSLCLKDGFDPAVLYELVYDVRDPLVLGVGLAAIRDLASFFRYESEDQYGTPNPIGGEIRHSIAKGTSQSGNALKTFLHLGFNEDLAGRIVFDGANPHIAGRLTAVNIRFGLPSGSGTLYEAGGEGVLWWTPYADLVRGRERASLLDRCTTSATCPKIFETFGATEFNARLMTVALTGTEGREDLALPDNVRRYYFPGTTHGGARRSDFVVAGTPGDAGVLFDNPNFMAEQMRALGVALVDWVVHDVEPPPSAYPTLAGGDLATNTAEAMGFPPIPGFPGPTGMAVGLADYDFGPDLSYNDFSGRLSNQPPEIVQIIPALMPRVDEDGNERAGVPSLLHEAPLGTYTGWNVTPQGFFRGQPAGGGLVGGYIPFATTRREREAMGDPRLSLEERYGTQEGYLCVVRKAAERQQGRRFLLGTDAERLVALAETANILPSEPANEQARAVADRLCE